MILRRFFIGVTALLALGSVAWGADLRLKGDDRAVIDHEVGFAYLLERAKLTIKRGARIAHLHARGNSEVVLEDGEVSHLTVSEDSTVRIFGGRVTHLSILGKAQAHLHRLVVGGQAIVYESATRLHLYADVVSVDFGIVKGVWSTGERFSIGLVEKRADADIFARPAAAPEQLIAHELPGPAFDCRRASSKVERAVCADKELAQLDKELAKRYAQAVAASEDQEALRKAQLRWLSERNKCVNRACIEAAYRRRIQAMDSGGWMTNRKVHAICDAVVQAVNDGSISSRFVKFEAAQPNDRAQWNKNRPDRILSLSEVAKIPHRGKPRLLGTVVGGGTCGNCDIVDLEAKVTTLYPEDDEEERLRWASWSHCDHLVIIDGEPIVVTGSFGSGRSAATLVTWVAPDGAKRALCHLARSGPIGTQILKAENPELCRAVTRARVDERPWDQSLSLDEQSTRRVRSDQVEAAHIDVDLDGAIDTIARLTYHSGAGCGSTQQWLQHALRKESPRPQNSEPSVEDGDQMQHADHSYALTESALSRMLSGINGPIPGAGDDEVSFALKLFSFRGRPYLLGRGGASSAAVYSVWRGEKRTWCEFNLLPQHKAEVYYPIETWPTAKSHR